MDDGEMGKAIFHECWLSGKESACNTGDLGSIPRLGRSPGVGNGNPLQYSCLENPMERGGWWATVHGVTKSWTRLSRHAHTHTHTPHFEAKRKQGLEGDED